MQASAPRFISEQEYCDLEAESEVKHEYFNGCIYAMAGGTNRHAVLCTNASVSLGTRLRGKPCRVVNSEQRVKVEATGLHTYPDISVYCPPARFEGSGNQVLLTPVVIVEVLSPSTEGYDKGMKFDHYKEIVSLKDYLLVAQNRMQVDHYHRLESGDWLLHTIGAADAAVRLESIDCSLSLGELYDGVDMPPGPGPLRSAS